MDLERCLKNLKADVNNGGVKEDTFAVTCYITVANMARRMLGNGANQQEAEFAREYLALCRRSGSDILRYISKR
jgi:hypothetical protein